MKAKRFEDLIVWQRARELTKLIYKITNRPSFLDYSLKDQIRRAAVSVMSNIAEGFERGSKEETVQFLYIAKASCGEVRAQLYIVLDQKYIDQTEFEEIKKMAQIVSASIYKFIESLKNSTFKGLKFKQQKRDDIDAFLAPYLKRKD
jgi:four helix bundle protein